jgi:AcrR family transcriptional regulator
MRRRRLRRSTHASTSDGRGLSKLRASRALGRAAPLATHNAGCGVLGRLLLTERSVRIPGMASVAARVVADVPRMPGLVPAGTAGRILEVGLSLFARRGYDGASIRDIGKELGLKPANLYDHFPSKGHLLAELVRVGHEEHLRTLTQALVATDGGPGEQLRAIVRAHVRFHASFAMLAVVANNEMHSLSRELVAPALALRQQSEGLIIGVIERGAEQGLFDPPDVWLTAAAIGGMGMRVAHWYKPARDLSIDQLCDVYAELAARMVGARGAGPRRR